MTDPALQQRRNALKKADEVRLGRAKLRRDVKAGKVTIVDLIAEPPPEAATAQVGRVLGWAPMIGKRKSERICVQVRMSPSRTLGALTDHERGRLLLHLQASFASVWARWEQSADLPVEAANA